MKETFPKDDFGVIVENSNGKEIIEYLASKGFNKYNLSGGAQDNSFYSVLKGTKHIHCSSGKYFSKTYTIQELKQLENMIDYTIPGTKLPKVPRGIEYRGSHWSILERNKKTELIYTDYISFGSRLWQGEIWILAEKKDYVHAYYYLFKLTDLQKLTNQNMEEQEIIGYKLVKENFLNAVKEITNFRNYKYTELEEFGSWAVNNNPNPTSCYTALKKAGVLYLWFEPVYITQYKVGDWVITTNDSKNYDGIPLKITEIFKGSFGKTYCKFHLHESNNFYFNMIKRLATKEEIEKASEQIISMNGKFNLTIKDKKVFHNNTEDITNFVIELVEHYSKTSFDKYNVRIGGISFNSSGCQNHITYITDWLKVYDLIK